jgi:hypothetical protein
VLTSNAPTTVYHRYQQLFTIKCVVSDPIKAGCAVS